MVVEKRDKRDKEKERGDETENEIEKSEKQI